MQVGIEFFPGLLVLHHVSPSLGVQLQLLHQGVQLLRLPDLILQKLNHQEKKTVFYKLVHLLNDSTQVISQQLLPLHAAEQLQLGLHKLLLCPVISFPDNRGRKIYGSH